ncbi:MAG: hypothetical protein LBB26_03470 [Puniceicoccales bacterium]|nr:hypothetical protein [Puniceicoccales bacterium]
MESSLARVPTGKTSVEVQSSSTSKTLQTITHPCRGVATTLGIITGGLTAAGCVVIALGSGIPPFLAIGVLMLLAAGGIGIVALSTASGSTDTWDNIRTLCTLCKEHHREAFEEFIGSPKFVEVAKRDAGGCWSAKQDRKDSDVLNLLVTWIATSEVFTPTERTKILNELRTHDSGMRQRVSKEVVKTCAKVGAVEPFKNALRSICWFDTSDPYTRRHYTRENNIIKIKIRSIVQVIPLMPEFAQKDIIKQLSMVNGVWQYCLSAHNVASKLFERIEKLDPPARWQLLSLEDGYGATLVHQLGAYSKAPGLVPKLFKLLGDKESILASNYTCNK